MKDITLTLTERNIEWLQIAAGHMKLAISEDLQCQIEKQNFGDPRRGDPSITQQALEQLPEFIWVSYDDGEPYESSVPDGYGNFKKRLSQSLLRDLHNASHSLSMKL